MLHTQSDIVQRRIGPLWEKSQFRDTKDPCPVFDGHVWHIYGSGGAVGGEQQEEWTILHATAPAIEGPWAEQKSVKLKGLKGKHIAAPGVVYDKGIFHMFVQTEFLSTGGTIEYLTSIDGKNFTRQHTALASIEGSHEAALYDPHPAIIRGKKYFTYSGSNFIGKLESSAPEGWEPSVGMPDIFLAKSITNTWAGPWVRVGKILDHEDVVHHNQRGHLSYEWGLEGSQLIELPNGVIAMNAVCFLPHGKYGTRQRIFFAFADKITGPYHSAGTVLATRPKTWEDGENGHAAAFMRGHEMVLFYQARPKNMQPWRYGIAYFNIRMLEKIGRSTVDYYKMLSNITKTKKENELTVFAQKLANTKAVLSITEYTRGLRLALRKKN